MRRIHVGEVYTIIEEDEGLIELEQVEPIFDPPPENTRGEPWDWPDGKPDKPRGWRRDGRYDGS